MCIYINIIYVYIYIYICILCVCSLSMHDGFAGKTRSSSDDSHEYSAGRHCQGGKEPRKELKYDRVWMILVARSAWLAPTRSTLDPKLV